MFYLASSYDGGRPNVSIYEYLPVFDVENFRGNGQKWVQIDMVGLDGNREAVAGTSDRVVLLLE